MNNGYTIEPQLTVNPETGDEVLNYDHAVVHDHSIKEQINRQHQQEQQYAVKVDEHGNTSHAWDIEGSEQYSDDYEEEYSPDEEEDDSDEVQAFTDEVFDQVGYDNYKMVTNWAHDHLSEEQIEVFNDAIDSLDLDRIRENISVLIQLYNEHN